MRLTDLIEYVIMSIRVKKYKKLLQEVKYLRSELEYQNEVLAEYHQLFEEYYRSWCAQNNIDIGKQEEQNSDRVEKILPKPKVAEQKYDSNDMVVFEEPKQELKEDTKKMNKLYRKLAMELHPDKQNGDEKRFTRLNEAYENGKWSVLLEEAIELGIEPDNFSYLSKLLRNEAKELKKQITHNKGVYSWKYYECDEDEDCKIKLIKDFLKHLFNLEVQ